MLKKVHPICQADGRDRVGRWRSSDVIPRGPGNVSLWHELWYVSIPPKEGGPEHIPNGLSGVLLCSY